MKFLGRFIPTCVGNSPVALPVMFFAAVHPHMRGEQSLNSSYLASVGGSSPHAWGTGPLYCESGIRNRFIPTCVGNRTDTGDT